ncbi:MAG: hypothetical protein Q7T76_05285 [Ferruginibacter sp.]|nr:hypothetical protein [Ferruginibacter sp.]
MKKILQQPAFIKLFNWEYWPFNVVYAPMFLCWFWFCFRARSMFFFNTSNPTIKNGGFLMESKKEIYDLMPAELYPATLPFTAGTPASEVLLQLKERHMNYPLIAKPDIGLRGMSVQKIDTENELVDYINGSKVDYLVQIFIPFENEIGIFYYRYPNQQQGRISGIVGKEFLTVEGDGVTPVLELLKRDPRYILQLEVLQQTHAEILQTVLPKGIVKLLVPYGNHCRGTKFVDVSELIDEKLTHSIDAVCRKIPGFYFGRMDIRYNTWEELREGKNFSIIELNGAGSEPTHIYDPRHSIFYAWKEILRHWVILLEISKQNHRQLKMPYMKFSVGMQMLKENGAYLKLMSTQFDLPARAAILFALFIN